MECVICGGNVGVGIFAKKCDDGAICSECAKILPTFFKAHLSEKGAARFLARTYDEENATMCKQFRETARVGKLHMDGEHLLAVIGRINKDGTVDEGNPNIFSLANVDTFFFSTVNAKEINPKKVSCDVQFTCSFLDTSFAVNEIVSVGETCSATEENEELYFGLPAGVQIAWDEIARRINLKRGALSNAIDEELVTEADMAYFKAKTLFMLENGYSKVELEDSYERLRAGFEGDEGRLSIIESAKNTLAEYLQE